jgi:hypothetical protein
MGDARPGHSTPQDDEPPPENIKEALLEREVRQLREQVRSLQSGLRICAKTLQPYAKR